MKVLVLGGGVIGVTSAWYLHGAGHEVTVVDRQAGPGLETSFANGGQISWGAGNPWAAPGIPLKALKWMLRPHSPLVLRPRLDPALWTWLFSMLANCTPERYALNKERMLRVSRYSHECLVGLRRETGIHYDEHLTGVLELFRTARELDEAGRDITLLKRWGIDCHILDRAGCVAQESALRPSQEKIVGGLHFPGDESGDCFQFTQLPVYPVKGYSVTLPLTDAAAAPSSSVTDATYKIVITRLGDKLRGAGTAELAGYDLSLRPARLGAIKHVMADLFPDAVNQADALSWCGLRPMTPDNPPILGATTYKNLFLNTGHGTLGWTMACGSGKILADIVSGRPTDTGLTSPTVP